MGPVALGLTSFLSDTVAPHDVSNVLIDRYPRGMRACYPCLFRSCVQASFNLFSDLVEFCRQGRFFTLHSHGPLQATRLVFFFFLFLILIFVVTTPRIVTPYFYLLRECLTPRSRPVTFNGSSIYPPPVSSSIFFLLSRWSYFSLFCDIESLFSGIGQTVDREWRFWLAGSCLVGLGLLCLYVRRRLHPPEFPCHPISSQAFPSVLLSRRPSVIMFRSARPLPAWCDPILPLPVWPVFYLAEVRHLSLAGPISSFFSGKSLSRSRLGGIQCYSSRLG